MKITKTQLRQLIKEELESSMGGEMHGGDRDATFAAIHGLLKSGAPERYQAADLGKLQAAMEAMSPEDLATSLEAIEELHKTGMLESFFAIFEPQGV